MRPIRVTSALDPLRTSAAGEKQRSMNDGGQENSSLQNGHWQVQPRWAKAVAVLVGLPAWFVLLFTVVTSHIGALQTAAFSVFAGVALLQLGFVFRAYWRMDL